jgi:hypothetical protein
VLRACEGINAWRFASFEVEWLLLICHVLCVPDPLDLCSRFFIVLSENEKSAAETSLLMFSEEFVPQSHAHAPSRRTKLFVMENCQFGSIPSIHSPTMLVLVESPA